MPERVRITDVSPRDGLQNEAGVVPAAAKARLIGLLADAGVDEIEATSFVSPKWVPQLGDAEQVLAIIDAEAPSIVGPVLSVLVPNAVGFEKALAVHRAGLPLKIAVFTAASETFSRRNTNASIAETIERFAAFLPRAFAEGMAVRMYISCAVACPFEGPITPAAVRRVADMLRALVPAGASADLDLGDTIGVARPADIAALLGEFTGAERAALTLHLHDTFGRAADCVRQALALGVRSFDGSVAGLGGCPYAGTKESPAPGNISTATLVNTVEREGFETGVNMGSLENAARYAREIVATARAAASTGSAR